MKLYPTIYLEDDPEGTRLVYCDDTWWICYGGKNNGGTDSLNDALRDCGYDPATVGEEIRALPGWDA